MSKRKGGGKRNKEKRRREASRVRHDMLAQATVVPRVTVEDAPVVVAAVPVKSDSVTECWQPPVEADDDEVLIDCPADRLPMLGPPTLAEYEEERYLTELKEACERRERKYLRDAEDILGRRRFENVFSGRVAQGKISIACLHDLMVSYSFRTFLLRHLPHWDPDDVTKKFHEFGSEEYPLLLWRGSGSDLEITPLGDAWWKQFRKVRWKTMRSLIERYQPEVGLLLPDDVGS